MSTKRIESIVEKTSAAHAYTDLARKAGISEYASYADVQAVVTDTMVLDALKLIGHEDQAFLDCLVPEPRGVYLHSQLFPIVNFDEKKYRLKTPKESELGEKPLKPRYSIETFEDFVNATGVVLDEKDEIVCRAPKRFAKEFRDTPRWPINSLMVTITSVISILRDEMHPGAALTGDFPQTADKWLKEDYQTAAVKARDYAYEEARRHAIKEGLPMPEPEPFQEFNPYHNPGVEILLHAVRSFIGRDHTCGLRFTLTGPTLRIEKGYDFRILQYYQALFSKVDDLYTEQYGF